MSGNRNGKKRKRAEKQTVKSRERAERQTEKDENERNKQRSERITKEIYC